MTRLLIALCCAALLAAAACSGGGSPTSPSETVATITDTVTADGNGGGKGNGDKGKDDKGKDDKGKDDKGKDDKGNGDKGNGDNGGVESGGGTSGGNGGATGGGNGGATVEERLTSPVEIKKFTNGQHADRAPGPSIPIGNPVVWTYLVTNRSAFTFTSLSVTDDRGVAVACPRTLPAAGASVTCTGSGTAVAGQYRNIGTVTVTANGNQYTASDVSHYFGGRVNGVTIEKFTNGEDVSQAPGPRIPVGSPVTWTYVITNRSAATFTSLSVTDDRGVSVACPRILPAPGESLTCTGSGTAMTGQYRNVGTVVATANGATYTDSDESFYFGRDDEDDDARKVQLCHRTGNGSFHMIEVSVNAERAHRAHGDGKVGEVVPGSPGRVFTESCSVR